MYCIINPERIYTFLFIKYINIYIVSSIVEVLLFLCVGLYSTFIVLYVVCTF
jgi:hypothetical protein